jgi:hypothetical protein
MAKNEIITKRLAISKANAQMVAIIGVAAFVTVFCLIAAKSVLSQNEYQSRVISAQDKAKVQLEANLSTYKSLSDQYNQFVADPTNILGGQSSSTANNGGSNSKLILDALPPVYDFPALASSIAGILKQQGVDVTGISGTDEQLTEQANTSSPNPAPVSMPFSFTVQNLNYQGIGNLLDTLQKSIRPIAIDSLTVNGGGNSITLSVQAHTYFQPAKSLGITEQEVK